MSKPLVSSAGRFWGLHTIYGPIEAPYRYMTRAWLGRLRLHLFWAPDLNRDPHDHPWGFWTFPLRGYYENVYTPVTAEDGEILGVGTTAEYVPGWRWTYREASHTHQVVRGAPRAWPFRCLFPGRWPLATIVWRDRETGRKWGFLKNPKIGQWCRQYWRDYCAPGGASAPCSPVEKESR